MYLSTFSDFDFLCFGSDCFFANMIDNITSDISLVWAFITASHLTSSISIRATGYVTK